MDDAHAFLNAPLHAHDSDLLGWVEHFTRAAEREAQRGRVFPWRYSELGSGQVMIYAHQVQKNGRWCCEAPA